MQHILRLENMRTGSGPVGLVDCLESGNDHAETAKERARQLLAICRQRKAVFGAGRMTDPLWEILILTFVADKPVSRELICSELALPAGVVSRWISIAEGDGLIAQASGLIMASYAMTEQGQSLMIQTLT